MVVGRLALNPKPYTLNLKPKTLIGLSFPALCITNIQRDSEVEQLASVLGFRVS